MGLDITAYKGAVIIVNGEPAIVEGGRAASPYRNSDFPYQFEGLYERKYIAHDSFEFRAGSYGGYGDWRRKLAQLAGVDNSPHRSEAEKQATWESRAITPFHSLIFFSDCEGSIGPVACARLAKDFAEWQEAAEAVGDSYFLDRYNDWRKAFEFGSTGWVGFH